MDGTLKRLRDEILASQRGRIFFIDDFSSYESQWSVRYGLSKLTEEKIIIRIARGIYCYPMLSSTGKIMIPGEETIAEAIARKEKIRILEYGDKAAHRLGLTTMMISDLKYLTDGAPRKISLANGRKIWFNHTSEVKMFSYQNQHMQDICCAIRMLGKEQIDPLRRRKIHEALMKVPESDYKVDMTIPPAWVQEIVNECWNS